MSGRVIRNRSDYGCPEWCVAQHEVEDEGGVRRHRSAAVSLGVIEKNLASAGEATEVAIEMHRTEGESTTWVYVGDGFDQYLEVSLESVRRLVATLARVVG
jgi:hypothetical protein